MLSTVTTIYVSLQAVDNPTYSEIRDVCASAGLTVGVEVVFLLHVHYCCIDKHDMMTLSFYHLYFFL